MIYLILGPPGSGKSTLVRTLMRRCETVRAVLGGANDTPLAYSCTRYDGTALEIIGNYEPDRLNGGLDAAWISGEDVALWHLRHAGSLGYSQDVLMEGGFFRQADYAMVDFAADILTVVLMDVTTDICAFSLATRRGKEPSIKQIEKRRLVAEKVALKLHDHGARLFRAETRQQAVEYFETQLRLAKRASAVVWSAS